jgi:hypothetical protein
VSVLKEAHYNGLDWGISRVISSHIHASHIPHPINNHILHILEINVLLYRNMIKLENSS